MDRRNTYFLQILSAALKGEQAALNPPLTAEDWQWIAQQAQRHKVLPLICQAARDTVPPQLKASLRRQVAEQMLKTHTFLQLNRHLCEAGLTPLVVKGIVCRELYPDPDLRQSSDEDLLLPQEQFEKGCDAMEAFGMTTDSTDPNAAERPYRMAENPLYIELHRSLFPLDSDVFGNWNRFFEGCFDRAVTLDIAGEQVLTLNCTDHLLYLILHAFKHFLHSGFGIRQVCDIVMYGKAHAASVDWPQLLDRCCQVHAHLFTAAIFRIGEHCLHIDCPAPLKDLQVDETALLEDLLSAGIYGGATESRKHSSTVTLGAAAHRDKESGSSLRSALFPPAKVLSDRYPYLKRHQWLLPVAWVSRMIRYGTRKNNGENSASEALRIGNQRVALLRQYGVIE